VQGIAWSPDNTRIASGYYDRTVLVWEAATGKHVCMYRHCDAVFAVAWSPDGMYVASAGRDKTVQVWLVEDKKHQLPGTGIDDEG